MGKYIGRGDIVGAKRAAKVGVILAVLINSLFGVVFIFGRDALPGIYTDNEETLELTSSMMVILWIYAAGCIILNVFGGIYRFNDSVIHYVICCATKCYVICHFDGDIFISFKGVYRGMGIQKVAAVMVFVSYWVCSDCTPCNSMNNVHRVMYTLEQVISFPLSLILLFGFELRNNLFYGSFLIWGSLAVGNILGCIAEIVYLGFWADWKYAVHKAMLRVRHTMSDVMNTKYKSTENCDKLRDGVIQIVE